MTFIHSFSATVLFTTSPLSPPDTLVLESRPSIATCLKLNITEEMEEDIVLPTLSSQEPPRLNSSKAKTAFDELMCERRSQKIDACKANHVKRITGTATLHRNVYYL